MRVGFVGTPNFAVPVLEGLLRADYQVVVVYTRPDRPAGRGRGVAYPLVKTAALRHGIPVRQPPSLRRSEVVAELRAFTPDVLVVAAYGRFLPAEVLAVPPNGVLNIHPSLLPAYRGPSPVATALLEGESITGATVMLVDEGMDSGPVLAQRETRILPHETAGSLTPRLFQLGAELLLEVLPAWLEGRLAPRPQDGSLATTTRLYTREDGELDWSLPAEEMGRRLRAFDPWPGCYTYWEGKLLKVLEGRVLEPATQPNVGVGEVVRFSHSDETPVAVNTGRGLLGISRIQLEGRRTQSVAEFLHGYPRFMGARLPS
jgi:methionyl-tRNA formyltransferase